MTQLLLRLLEELGERPVLVDVGASYESPASWSPIAAQCIYLGFDPDLRGISEVRGTPYHTAYMLNEAVSSDPAASETRFYLTHSPPCSSTLLPESKPLADYIFADLFAVERATVVRTTTLEKALARLGLSGVDWLKVDSQGTDLRIFTSLGAGVRSRILALDIEPGLIDAYQGEDLFVEAQGYLSRHGFWLSRLDVNGTVRMRQSTLRWLRSSSPDLNSDALTRRLRHGPAWCNARYLRTLDWLAEQDARRRDYFLLWVFAWIDEQFGYALDIALEYERRFEEPVARTMRDETVERLRQASTAPAASPKRGLIRRVAQRLSGLARKRPRK